MINNKSKNKQKGMTLIALVLTIIVLLILAGITISMLSGENGILKKIAEAKNKMEQAKNEETKILTNIQTLVNGSVKENTEYIDEDGNKIVIPMNFKISLESPLKVTEGMIIEDSEQNQYVWIPVLEKSNKYKWGVDYTAVKDKTEDTQEYYKAIEEALNTYTYTYKKDTYYDKWYKDENYGYFETVEGEKTLINYTSGNMTEKEYNELYNKTLKSIYINKGFYIGRYEMGIEVVKDVETASKISRTGMTEYKASEDNETNEKPSIEGMKIPVSQANAVPYNYITNSQAQMLAQELGKKNDYSNVTSSIMFGIQFKSVYVFIEKFDKNPEKLKLENPVDWIKNCRLWGNYYNTGFKLDRGFYTRSSGQLTVTWIEDYNATNNGYWLNTTGASERNCSLNIYDLAGNEAEYTLETGMNYNDLTQRYAHKGGYFRHNHSPFESGLRQPYSAGDEITSRVSLII